MGTGRHGKGYASFLGGSRRCHLTDAVFSLDAVITAVGVVTICGYDGGGVVIAMAVMLLASKPLTRLSTSIRRWWCSV